MFSFYIFCYGIASEFIWQGYINPITDERYAIGPIISVIIAVMISMMVFPSVMPIMPTVMGSLISTKEVYKLLERVPEIRDAEDAVEVTKLDQKISFNNIRFRYPK